MKKHVANVLSKLDLFEPGAGRRLRLRTWTRPTRPLMGSLRAMSIATRLVATGRTVGGMGRDGKRADLIVHEDEPFNAETGLAALAEGRDRHRRVLRARHGAVPESTRRRGACACDGPSSASSSSRWRRARGVP